MPEYALGEAQGRLPEIVSAAERGERVIITRNASQPSNWCAANASGAAASTGTG